MNKVRIGIIGVGGYAQTHFQSATVCAQHGLCEIRATVIRESERQKFREIEESLLSRGITVYRDYDTLLDREQGKLDLITIPTGIDQHAEQSILALDAGFHVLCEKPAAGTPEDGLKMQEAARKSGKILAIGYQYICSPSVQRIKAFCLEGTLGRLLSAKTYVMWPRSSVYYKRNDWAGKMQYQGRWIYDSPVQNATSHFLNNMLYAAGNTPHNSAEVISVYGENYRAKDIASADTQYLRAECRGGVTLQYFATHAVQQNIQPVTEYFFEQGKIVWQMVPNGKTQVYKKQGAGESMLIAEWDDGTVCIKDEVFFNIIEALNTGKMPFAHIGNSLSQLFCVKGSFESSGGVAAIDQVYLERLPAPETEGGNEYNTIIKGIEATIQDMYNQDLSFFEYGLPWARESRKKNC